MKKNAEFCSLNFGAKIQTVVNWFNSKNLFVTLLVCVSFTGIAGFFISRTVSASSESKLDNNSGQETVQKFFLSNGSPEAYFDNDGTLTTLNANSNTLPNNVNGKIVFNSGRDDINGDIFTMNSDGSNQTRLTINTAVDLQPQWSPDGTKIVFRSERDGGVTVSAIYVMDADGEIKHA